MMWSIVGAVIVLTVAPIVIILTVYAIGWIIMLLSTPMLLLFYLGGVCVNALERLAERVRRSLSAKIVARRLIPRNARK
jgi:hypothetical protein